MYIWSMKSINLLLLVSFLEGSALMAAEILSAKIMAPYYGNSLVVWTSVFVCTLSGLALGYYFGGKLSAKEHNLKNLQKVLLFSTVFFVIMSPLSSFMMELTLSFPIELGSIFSVIIFLMPLLIAFGMVSPLIINLLTKEIKEAGNNAGNVYTISTVGGIITTLIIGLYAIPTIGIKTSIFMASGVLFIATIITYKVNKNELN
jgi:predicted membrane-bound spermidine synthase